MEIHNNKQLAYKAVSGTFDGENFRGDRGESYPIPSNYASKSKLVEGDQLKCYINPDGSMFFKQLNPVERIHFIGVVVYDPDDNDEIKIQSPQGEKYKVLKSSVRYYKLTPGEEVACLTAANSTWVAIETVIEKNRSADADKELDL